MCVKCSCLLVNYGTTEIQNGAPRMLSVWGDTGGQERRFPVRTGVESKGTRICPVTRDTLSIYHLEQGANSKLSKMPSETGEK